jgi:hypothetical protein
LFTLRVRVGDNKDGFLDFDASLEKAQLVSKSSLEFSFAQLSLQLNVPKSADSGNHFIISSLSFFFPLYLTLFLIVFNKQKRKRNFIIHGNR